ncbi:hypothetical protein [Fluviispira multicolorata]|uniref:hypothetical protein n=1 Tax=Fluviispira multicolorata TaxID=2654512 RepID=UPI001375C372|nr:hypothetical protein [Fluviispira multicolorata]
MGFYKFKSILLLTTIMIAGCNTSNIFAEVLEEGGCHSPSDFLPLKKAQKKN